MSSLLTPATKSSKRGKRGSTIQWPGMSKFSQNDIAHGIPSSSAIPTPPTSTTRQNQALDRLSVRQEWYNYGVPEMSTGMNVSDMANVFYDNPGYSQWQNSNPDDYTSILQESSSKRSPDNVYSRTHGRMPTWSSLDSQSPEVDYPMHYAEPYSPSPHPPSFSPLYTLSHSQDSHSLTMRSTSSSSDQIPTRSSHTVMHTPAPNPHSGVPISSVSPLCASVSFNTKENMSLSSRNPDNSPLPSPSSVSPSKLEEAVDIVPQRKRRKRMTEDEQVIDVLQYMKRNYRLSLPKVVSRVFNSDNEILVNFCTHFCEDPDSLITLLEKVYAQSNGFDAINSFLEKHALEVVVAAVDSEFKKAQPLVQRASEKIDLEFLRTWSPSRLVQSLDMPNTKSLIAKMTTGRSTDENKLKDNQVLRDTLILQMMHGRSNLSNYLQQGIGLYTWSTGVSKQTTELLSHYGLSTSTVTVERAVNSIGKSSVEEGKLSPYPRFGSYDNVNLSHGNSYEQRLDAPSKVQSGTFTLIYELPHIPWKTLEIEPIIKAFKKAPPLTIDDITASDEQVLSFYKQTRVHFVEILLKNAEEFEDYPSRHHPLLSHAARHKLPRNRHSNFFPLRIATIEEASVSGQILVHDDIFINQLDCDNPLFPDRAEKLRHYAVPFCTDQLTLSRTRSAQRERARDIDVYQTRQIIQLVFGMFHFIMNLMWALLGVHRGTLDDLGSLSFFFSVLDKVRLGQDRPDYHTLRMALMQILDGIVLAAWDKIHGFASFTEFAKSKPTPEQLLRLADKIYTDFRFHETKTDTSQDKAFFNLQLLLRDLLYVRELLDAVSSGDIGRCEDIFPDLAHIFRGAGSNNYSVEILWFLHNMKNVWSSDFANVMRECMIVNIDGHFMPTDLNIEHFIGYIKELFSSKGIYSGWTRFGNVTAAVKALMTLRHRVAEETQLSYQKKGHTTPASVKKLVLRVADTIKKHQLQEFLPNLRPGNESCHSVPDLMSKGRTLLLGRTLKAFNESLRGLADAYGGKVLREDSFSALDEESRDSLPANGIIVEDNSYTALNYSGRYDNDV